MSLIVRPGQNFELVPAGMHVARCIGVVDLGTQASDFRGKTKKMRKAILTWETPNEQRTFKEEEGPQPFRISKEYTVSFSNKANLKHMIESWRGKEFTDEELKEGFDVMKLLGQPCMIQVIHRISQQGNKYVDITAITSLPRGMECPPQIRPIMKFSFDDLEWGDFESLPEWIQNRIKDAPEYQAAMEPDNNVVSGNGGGNKEDDLPF